MTVDHTLLIMGGLTLAIIIFDIVMIWHLEKKRRER